MTPLVTVIINTYNERPEWLKQTIDAYLRQSGVNVQIIVSTVENDPSIWSIRAGYPNQIPVELAILPLSKHPGRGAPGAYAQINNAIPLIKGEWVTYMSSNDVPDKHKLFFEYLCCVKHEAKICYSSYHYADLHLENQRLQQFHTYTFEKHLGINFVSDCALVSRDIFDKYTPFRTEFKNYAHWDFWLRVCEGEGEGIFCYESIPTWIYRQNEDSMHLSRKQDPVRVKENAKDREFMLSKHR